MFHLFYVSFSSHKVMRVTGARPSDVATSHVQLIQVLTMPQSMNLLYYFIYSYFNFGPHTRPAEAISVSAAKLINSMFPHVLFLAKLCIFL